MSTNDTIGISIKQGQGITQALKEFVEKSNFKLSDGFISRKEWQNTLNVLDEIQASRVANNKTSLFGKNYLVHAGTTINFTAEEMDKIYNAMGVIGHTGESRDNVNPSQESVLTNSGKSAEKSSSGNTKSQSGGKSGKTVSGKEIANSLHDDIYAKTKWGFPTTGKDIGKHISMINKDNVNEVCSEYSKRNNEHLLSAILSERGLPPEERAKYLKHVSNAMLDAAKDKGIYVDDLAKDFDKEIDYQMNKFGLANADFLMSFTKKLNARKKVKQHGKNTEIITPNGKIDKDFRQGRTGDCWLLASIKAIAQTDAGLKLLNNSIKVDNKGNVTVTLKGAGKSYTITPEELQGATEFSSGDGDVRAIEIAMDRYFKEERGVNNWALFNPVTKDDLNGNTANLAFEILTGKGGRNCFSNCLYGRIADMWFTDSQIDNFNKKNHVAVVGASLKSDVTFASPEDGKSVTLQSDHSYTVKGSDKNNVYLINPHNTSKTIAVPRKQFKEFFNIIDEFDI